MVFKNSPEIERRRFLLLIGAVATGAATSLVLPGVAGAQSTTAADGEFLVHDGSNRVNKEVSLAPTIFVAASDARTASINGTIAAYQCDGTADEVQIQAALDALNALPTGGTLILSEGNFTCSAAINVPEQTNTKAFRILGTGRTATHITKTFNGDLFNVPITDTHKTNFEFGNMTIKTTGSPIPTGRILELYPNPDTTAGFAYGFYIHDLFIDHVDGDAIEIRRIGRGVLERVEVSDFGGNTGIWIHGGTSAIENVALINCKADGQSAASSVGVKIGTDESTGAVNDVLITGLEISRCGSYGLWLANTLYCDVINVRGEDVADTAAIRISGQNCNIRGGRLPIPANAIAVDVNFGTQHTIEDIYIEGANSGDTAYLIRSEAVDTQIRRGRIVTVATKVNDSGTGTQVWNVTGHNPQTIEADTVDEATAAAGVTVDGVLLKDGVVGVAYGGTGLTVQPTISKQFVFTATRQDAQVETLVPNTRYIGESAEHGTYTLKRFHVWLGVVGVTGTLTVKLYRVSGPLASDTEVEIATVSITTGSNGVDTSVASLSTDKYIRAKITAIHSGTAAKDVNCSLVVEEDLY